MEEQRERARMGTATRARQRGRPRPGGRVRARRRLPVALRRLRDDRGALERRRARARRRPRCSPSSPRARSTPRAGARSPTPGTVETRVRHAGASRTSTGSATTRRSRSRVERGELKEGERVRLVVDWRRAPRDRLQPHRHAPAARGAARAARAPRPPGRLGGAAGQAALRLHARQARCRARSSTTIEDRVNEWIAESHPVRAIHTTRAQRRGAGRDGAVRREVRRRGADGRGRGRLARALRRHARARRPPEIGAFKIVGEGSSAANVRRIEVVTGPEALELLRERDAALERIAARLRTRPEDARRGGRVDARARAGELERELQRGRRRAGSTSSLRSSSSRRRRSTG